MCIAASAPILPADAKEQRVQESRSALGSPVDEHSCWLGLLSSTILAGPPCGEMLKSIILVPHSLVHKGSDVFLVVCQGRFAARAWPATKIPQSHADLGGSWAFVP